MRAVSWIRCHLVAEGADSQDRRHPAASAPLPSYPTVAGGPVVVLDVGTCEEGGDPCGWHPVHDGGLSRVGPPNEFRTDCLQGGARRAIAVHRRFLRDGREMKGDGEKRVVQQPSSDCPRSCPRRTGRYGQRSRRR
jgi:hypothetical protein